ncbi:MAG: PilZ domain-containing protein [Deltaproteobacteria bacterium]|jgi:hypothetical protein
MRAARSSSEITTADTTALAAALARFDRPRITGRPPAPGSSLDVRASAISRAIEDELLAWLTAHPKTDARRVDVSCHVQLVAEGERWVGHTENLGHRGAFVATYLQVPLGASVEVRIELPTGCVIDVTAIVAGHRPPGGRGRAGLQLCFDAVPPESAHRISEVLQALSGELWRDLRA